MKSHYKKLAFSAIFAALLFTGIYTVKAQETVLFFSPTRVLITDEKPVQVVNISNTSKTARAYNISVEDIIMTPNGVTAPVDEFEYSAKRMIRFVPRKFILKPGERQTVRIMARIRGNTPDGAYHSHMRFLEDIMQRKGLNPPLPGGGAAIEAPMTYEALIPIVITHGNVTTKMGMTGATVKRGPAPKSYVVTLDLTRSGNGQGEVYIDYHYNVNGQKTLITPRRTVNIYREVDSIKRDHTLTLPEGAVPGGSLTITAYDSKAQDAQPVGQTSVTLN